MKKIEDVQIWRLYFRGRSYTRSFPKWFDASDVVRRLTSEGTEESPLAVELVT